MNKKIALLIYPQFSMQEIGNTIALFKWRFDSPTVVFASGDGPVCSEEGIMVKPEKTLADFNIEEYDCLVLPGCSDVRDSLKDNALISFLRNLKKYPDFVIGAICGGPLFLSMAGLLDDKKFINQLYVEMNERLPFIREKNIVYAPVVTGGNVVTAVAEAYAEFAVALARSVGYDCPDSAYKGLSGAEFDENSYKFHLDEQGIKMFEEVFAEFLF